MATVFTILAALTLQPYMVVWSYLHTKGYFIVRSSRLDSLVTGMGRRGPYRNIPPLDAGNLPQESPTQPGLRNSTQALLVFWRDVIRLLQRGWDKWANLTSVFVSSQKVRVLRKQESVSDFYFHNGSGWEYRRHIKRSSMWEILFFSKNSPARRISNIALWVCGKM